MKTHLSAHAAALALAAITLSSAAPAWANLQILEEQKISSVTSSGIALVAVVTGTDPQTGEPIVEYRRQAWPVGGSASPTAYVRKFGEDTSILYDVNTFIGVNYIVANGPPEAPEADTYLVHLEYDLLASYSLRFRLSSPHHFSWHGTTDLRGRSEEAVLATALRLLKVGGTEVFDGQGLDYLEGRLAPGDYEFIASSHQSFSGPIPEWFTPLLTNQGELFLQDEGTAGVPDRGSTAALLGAAVLGLVGMGWRRRA